MDKNADELQQNMLDQVSQQLGIVGGSKPSDINWENFNKAYTGMKGDSTSYLVEQFLEEHNKPDEDVSLSSVIVQMAYTATSDHTLVNDAMYFKLGVDMVNLMAEAMIERSKHFEDISD